MLELFICMSIWYLCRAVKIEKVFFLKNFLIHILTAFLLNFIWIVLMVLYAKFLDDLFKSTKWTQLFNQTLPVFITIGIALYFISILFHYLVLSSKRRKEAEQEVYLQQISKIRAELKALKATVHPHFLFNCLTLMQPLIRKDTDLAQSIVAKLGEFLLYSIKYSKKEYAGLREEVEHIKNYLSIEKLRLGDRLKIEYNIDEKILDIKVISLILLPLVENAIKHGIEQCLQEGILSITIKKLSPFGILLEVKNPYDELSPSRNGEGVGLDTLQKRLNSYYGEEARLEITKGENCYTVKIIILFNKG